jgi:hypothetical protein
VDPRGHTVFDPGRRNTLRILCSCGYKQREAYQKPREVRTKSTVCCLAAGYAPARSKTLTAFTTSVSARKFFYGFE